jgi:hypothetical protein
MSLTPPEKSGETISFAVNEGLFNGCCTLIPCIGGVALALRYPAFRKRTNWQVCVPTIVLYMDGMTRHLERCSIMASLYDHSHIQSFLLVHVFCYSCE